MAFLCAPSTGVTATPVTTGFAPRIVAWNDWAPVATAPVAITAIRLVVDELLPAGRAFLLVRLDEALDERDRMAADAAELIVDVPHGQLRAGGRQPADHDLTACWFTQPM